ncbi:MAG TPA: hypothetical protein VGT24_13175 [Candidatus Acidoferrales bacterium]|nr:hypothetical protein [Candidatus Acidoferrales bacterium]
MPENTSPRISLDDFKRTKEFAALTDRMRNFVLKYLENRDGLEAAKFAYPNVKSPLRLRNRLLGDSRIQDAINLWYGVSAKDAMIASLKRDIRRARSERVRFDLKVLLCKLEGFIQS